MGRIGLIRVVSYRDTEAAARHGRLLEERYPGLAVTTRCIPDQPEGIYDDASEAAAVPKIVALGKKMAAEDGIEALIVSCAADPGVPELRGLLSIPVIGAGTAAAAAAIALTDRIATVGITEETPARMKRALGSFLVGETRPEGVRNTLDLMKEDGKKKAIDACLRMVRERGAKAIALSCTGMTTIGVAADMEKAAGVPVIDPVLAAGWAAVYALGRRP